MKIRLILFLLAFSTLCDAQVINIPSLNFKTKLLNADTNNTIAKNSDGVFFKIDANNNGQIEVLEALEVSYLDISSSSILNMEGLQYFTNLLNLYCQNNFTNGGLLDVSMLTNLETLTCNGNNLSTLNVNGLTNLLELKCGTNNLSTFNISNLSNLKILNCSSSGITSLNLSGLSNLEELNCSNSNNLISINFSGCTNLSKVLATNCELSELNLLNLTNLTHLECSQNPFTSLNLNYLSNLNYLKVSDGQLTNLNVSNCSNLLDLWCNNNVITTINLQNCSALNYMDISSNQLSILNLDDCYQLEQLLCQNNQLTTLDLTNCHSLFSLNCFNNSLTSLFLKNGIFNSTINFAENPNLNFICCDDSSDYDWTPGSGEIDFIQNKVNTYGYTNCNVSSYCSFSPNGINYSITGNVKYDDNNNGCDSNDILVTKPIIKIQKNGLTRYFYFINENYNIQLTSGNFVINPIIEMSNYFNTTPLNATILFPPTTNPLIQDFCLTSNGIHNDLEIVVLPINQARPGFNANYTLIYKNKGTSIQSGIIDFTFDDGILDFVSSNPNVSTQSIGNITWNFTNLLPFESREINLVLNLNSPAETPALNSGDIVTLSANVNGQTDETPNDNNSILNQIVVNSYDPNDKTCLEGTTITPNLVGDYVHYLIRFENNGTANAQNIVVKDMIDVNKFDISTLIPIKGSHNFETRISNTNKVEFIFQNINLPFDDANNDGYISFKTKTKPNLVLGNSFSNSANIYFDYNFPVVTNNYTTTVQNFLGLEENQFSNVILVYPNPVKDFLNFNTDHTVVKIEVYDTTGRILSSNSISENKINLSYLKTGSYILKLYTEKGIMNTKIIKE